MSAGVGIDEGKELTRHLSIWQVVEALAAGGVVWYD